MSGAGTAVALVLWVILASLILLMALNDPHSHPLEFVIPGSHPLTWIAPGVVAGPPILLAIAHRAPPALRPGLAWFVAVALVGLFAAFLLFASMGL